MIGRQPPVSAAAPADTSRIPLAPHRAAPTIIARNPDPVIGHRRFVDGSVRPVFPDDAGGQYVLDLGGHTRLYRKR